MRRPRLSIDLNDAWKRRVAAVARAKAEREGRPCAEAHVVTICVNKHLAQLEQELGLAAKPGCIVGKAIFPDGSEQVLYDRSGSSPVAL